MISEFEILVCKPGLGTGSPVSLVYWHTEMMMVNACVVNHIQIILYRKFLYILLHHFNKLIIDNLSAVSLMNSWFTEEIKTLKDKNQHQLVSALGHVCVHVFLWTCICTVQVFLWNYIFLVPVHNTSTVPLIGGLVFINSYFIYREFAMYYISDKYLHVHV